MSLRIVGRSVIHDGWGRYLLLNVALPGGAVVTWQLDDHGGAAAVLPYDPARRVALLARLARVGPLYLGEDPYLIEAAAGRLDPGETGETCVRREAMEELGVRLSALEPVSKAWSSPGVGAERVDLFLAPYTRADRLGPGGGLAEEHEGIEVLERPLADIWRDAQGGEIDDMKTLLLIYALHARRPQLFD